MLADSDDTLTSRLLRILSVQNNVAMCMDTRQNLARIAMTMNCITCKRHIVCRLRGVDELPKKASAFLGDFND